MKLTSRALSIIAELILAEGVGVITAFARGDVIAHHPHRSAPAASGFILELLLHVAVEVLA